MRTNVLVLGLVLLVPLATSTALLPRAAVSVSERSFMWLGPNPGPATYACVSPIVLSESSDEQGFVYTASPAPWWHHPGTQRQCPTGPIASEPIGLDLWTSALSEPGTEQSYEQTPGAFCGGKERFAMIATRSAANTGLRYLYEFWDDCTGTWGGVWFDGRVA